MLANAEFRRRALFIAAAAVVIVLVLWNIPQLGFALYPFRLFVTFVHEAGHGLAAILSGGRFVSFHVDPNGSGFATTVGGSPALILPAGYLGAALFGAVLFYLANTVPYPRVISILLGGLVLVIAVLFGGILSVATIFGAVTGFALVAIGLRAGRDVNLLALNLLATLTALNAVLDLYFLIGNTDIRAGDIRNDAAAFTQAVAPLVPPAVWAFVWAVLAVVMLAVAVYASIIRPRRGRDNR